MEVGGWVQVSLGIFFLNWMGGEWVGGASSIQVFFGFLEFCNFPKSLRFLNILL